MRHCIIYSLKSKRFPLKSLSQQIESIWYNNHTIAYALLPFSWLFRFVAYLRRSFYQCIPKPKHKVPVVIVGNISVGGNGKTPVVIALAHYLISKGMHPGIVSRGYGTKPIKIPRTVCSTQCVNEVGDEPLLISKNTQCAVVVCANRNKAVQHLLDNYTCDVILSDDGLQHYALDRDIEIALVGGSYALGNQLCLPAGPLREPMTRLSRSDWVLGDASLSFVDYSIDIQFEGIFHLQSGRKVNEDLLLNTHVHAFAGIAHPARFFKLLSKQGILFETHIYPDHHNFVKEDFLRLKEEKIVMTEKDAIKCRDFVTDNMYYVKISAKLPQEFLMKFHERIIQTASYNCLTST